MGLPKQRYHDQCEGSQKKKNMDGSTTDILFLYKSNCSTIADRILFVRLSPSHR